MHYKMTDSNRKEEMSICPNQPAQSPPAAPSTHSSMGGDLPPLATEEKNTLFIGKSCAQLSGGLGLSPWLQRTCTVLGLDWECERARSTARAVPSATRPGWHHETKAAPSPCCLWVGECLCLWISPGLCMKDNSRCMSHQSRGSWSSSYVSLCLRQQIME